MTKPKPLPPAELLWEHFDYCPLSGSLIWRTALWNKPYRVNTPAGFIRNTGYVGIKLDGEEYVAHRLIWCWVTGKDPGPMQIDHRNGETADNRWINLRLATVEQQQQNKTRQKTYMGKDTQSGYKGVCVLKGSRSRPFRAVIGVGKKKIRLGTFATAEEAHAAYCRAAELYHGEFARTA